MPTSPLDNLDEFDLIWGAKAIGEEIGRTERQVFWLISKGHLRAVKQVGKLYVAERGRLRADLLSEEVA